MKGSCFSTTWIACYFLKSISTVQNTDLDPILLFPHDNFTFRNIGIEIISILEIL